MVAAIIVGHSSVVRIGVLVAALPLLTAWWVGRSRYRLALVRTVSPAARRRRPARHGRAHRLQRVAHADRRAAARGAPPLRPGHAPALRARGPRPRVAPPCDVRRALGAARPVRDRPDVGAGDRPVRARRAGPHLPRHDPPHRHPAHHRPAHHPARRGLDRVGRQPAARLRDRQRGGRHRPRVPPRRRPAPRALAQLGPRRRADGAARGAALAVARDRLPRQPRHRPTAARAPRARSRAPCPPPRPSRST